MRRYFFVGFVLASLAIAVVFQYRYIADIKNQRDMHKKNEAVLLGENERYRTKDSLSAISVRELTLKKSDFERFRSENAQLITTLKADKKRLESVTTSQSQTIYELRNMIVRDSVVYGDNVIKDSMKCIDYHDKWLDFTACFSKEGIGRASIKSRERLIYVEHIIPKRFLGFLWKTNRIKERRQEIVSENPYTEIVDAEFVTIIR